MTFEEMMQQLDELTLDEQLRLLEMLSGKIRRALKADADEDELSSEEIRAGIKEGLREAMRGEGVPISQLLAELDEE